MKSSFCITAHKLDNSYYYWKNRNFVGDDDGTCCKKIRNYFLKNYLNKEL